LKKIFTSAILLLFIDQITKLLVVYFLPNGGISVFGFEWFRIVDVRNPGMAFGLELPFANGKLFLTLFRISIVILGVLYIKNTLKKIILPTGVLLSFGLIIGGAIGNIVDSVFYNFYDKGLFNGEVVDMLQFHFFHIYPAPSFLSIISGSDNTFTFFAPVFNIADSGIFMGIVILLLFYRKILKNIG
tara:strand:- start:70 stop:630 length:561 start_codon:yes stop_codon:yes gene_type:complete